MDRWMDGGADGGGCWFKWMQSERHYRSAVVENVFTSPARGQHGGHIDASLSSVCLSAGQKKKRMKERTPAKRWQATLLLRIWVLTGPLHQRQLKLFLLINIFIDYHVSHQSLQCSGWWALLLRPLRARNHWITLGVGGWWVGGGWGVEYGDVEVSTSSLTHSHPLPFFLLLLSG